MANYFIGKIFFLMESDPYKRFLKDPLYQRLLRRLAKRDFVSLGHSAKPTSTQRIGVRQFRKAPSSEFTSQSTSTSSSTFRKESIPFKCGWLIKQGGGRGGRKNWYTTSLHGVNLSLGKSAGLYSRKTHWSTTTNLRLEMKLGIE